jgi:hypothetical protein
MSVVKFPGVHPTMAVTTQHSGGGGGNGMEVKVARLEADVGNIKTNIADIKIDVRSIRDKVDDVKDSIASAKVWALVLYIGLAATLLYVMAHGFKWL